MANSGQRDGEVGMRRITCFLNNKSMPDAEEAIRELDPVRFPRDRLGLACALQSFPTAKFFLDRFWPGRLENTRSTLENNKKCVVHHSSLAVIASHTRNSGGSSGAASNGAGEAM